MPNFLLFSLFLQTVSDIAEATETTTAETLEVVAGERKREKERYLGDSVLQGYEGPSVFSQNSISWRSRTVMCASISTSRTTVE